MLTINGTKLILETLEAGYVTVYRVCHFVQRDVLRCSIRR